MHGPKPPGHWTTASGREAFKHLQPNRRYVVSLGFRDYDGDLHGVGESWTFLGHSFLPHDDGLSLFVSPDDASEWHIRLQWRPEGQGAIIDDLGRFVEAASI